MSIVRTKDLLIGDIISGPCPKLTVTAIVRYDSTGDYYISGTRTDNGIDLHADGIGFLLTPTALIEVHS